MRFRSILPLGFVLFALPAALAASDWRQKITRDFMVAEDTYVRIECVKSVEPNEKGAVKALLAVLAIREPNRVDASVRAAAIERLGAATDEKAIEEIAKALVAKDPAHREAAALALGRIKAPAHYDAVGKLLEDKDPSVRRAAVRSIAANGDLKGVDLLLRRWERLDKEKAKAGSPGGEAARGAGDFRELSSIVAGLEVLTEQKHGRIYENWAQFWTKSKDGYKRPSEWTPEEKKAAEEARKKYLEDEEKKENVTTTLREVPISFTASGKGPIPLLVIHEDSWSPKYFEPYLSSLEEVCRVYLIELPSITKLKIKKRNIGGYPYWPYDELCDAFDEIRKEYKHEKFAILAHGFSTMIAARYMSKYPENVSHAIFVGPVPSDDAYGGVLLGVRAKSTGLLKDPELKRAVDSRFIADEKTFKRDHEPKTDVELESLERKFFTLMFANQQDPEIAEIWERCKKPASTSLKVMFEEQCQSPPYDIAREKKPNVPVLVISGEKSMWFGPADGKRVAENYPINQHVVLKNSGMMPWFEENAAFTEAVKAFFVKHAPRDKPKK